MAGISKPWKPHTSGVHSRRTSAIQYKDETNLKKESRKRYNLWSTSVGKAPIWHIADLSVAIGISFLDQFAKPRAKGMDSTGNEAEEKATLTKKLIHTLGFGFGYDVKPYGLRWRSNTYFIIFIVALSLLTENFLYGIVVPIMPFILHDRVGLPQEQWQLWVSVLLAVFAFSGILSGPVAGYIADILGSRKWPWLTCLGVMFISIVLFFNATTMPALVIARVFMGSASAAVWTIGLTLCLDTVGVKNLGKALSTVFAAVNFGGLIAPTLGGIFYDRLGLQACAAICYALIAVDLIGRLLVIEKQTATKYEGKPTASSSGEHSVSDDSVQDGGGIDANDGDEEAPLLNQPKSLDAYALEVSRYKIVRTFPILYCFRYPSFLASMLVHTSYAVILASWDATIPTHAIDVWQVNSLEAGLMMLPLSLVALAVGPIGGWCTDRYGPRFASTVGSLWLVPWLILLRIPKPEPKDTQIALYEAFLGLATIGISFINTPSFKVTSGVVEKCHKRNLDLFGPNGPYASLYALFNMSFSTGLTFGPLICGAISDRIGYGNMNLVLGLWMAFIALVSFMFMGETPKLPFRWS